MDEIAVLTAIRNLEEAEYHAMDYNRRFFDKYDPFELSDKTFVRLFRINKSMADELIDRLDPYLVQPIRASALDSVTKVTTTLRVLASGSYQLDIADNRHISTSQSSVSRNLNEVINAVHDSSIFADFVNFPDSFEKIQSLRNAFARQSGFPGVIGCIDCTHVALFPPQINDPIYPENLYVNRKNYHSINVQLICDNELRVLHVNAKYPGSTHDSFIWNNSNVCPIMQELHRRYPFNFALLGDSGYALRPWMLTPISDAVEESPEYYYNKAQMSLRSTVERLNGVLKMRWRCCLKHKILHYAPSVASKMINTCVALHNMCRDYELQDPDPEPEDDLIDFYEGLFNNENIANNMQIPAARVNPLLWEGRILQQRIVRNYYT